MNLFSTYELVNANYVHILPNTQVTLMHIDVTHEMATQHIKVQKSLWSPRIETSRIPYPALVISSQT